MHIRDYLHDLAQDKQRGFVAGVTRLILFEFSLIYGLVVRMLILFYTHKPCRIKCKVISVGNITLGGTGKTTLVEYIACYLKEHGRNVAIISRGYKRRSTVHGPRSTEYATMGDEPYMLSRKLKDISVIVDADRIRGANQAIKDNNIDTIILDDGMQQWKLAKDLEIVLLDATNPFGNKQLIPRGILREPLSGLRRAGVFVLTKTNLVSNTAELKRALLSLNPKAEIYSSAHVPVGFYNIKEPGCLLGLEILRRKTVALFSGIGDPGSFEDMIRRLGIEPGLSYRFPDHHNYTRKDLNTITKNAQGRNIEILVTTQKDAARISESDLYSLGCQIYVFSITIRITADEDKFHNRLLGLYSD